MTAFVKVDPDALLKWARYLDEVPKRTRPAIARAMNEYGSGVVTSTAEAIAEQTGLPVHEVRNMIEVEKATPGNLVWKMDATVVAQTQDWQRPWAKRSGKDFEQEALVKIVTSGDEVTCEICEEAAERSPYTIDEINQIAAKWKHWQPAAGLAGARTNLLHPNCRCVLQPWRQTRRVAVKFGGKGAPTELLNARQLGRRVADELKVSIRATKI